MKGDYQEEQKIDWLFHNLVCINRNYNGTMKQIVSLKNILSICNTPNFDEIIVKIQVRKKLKKNEREKKRKKKQLYFSLKFLVLWENTNYEKSKKSACGSHLLVFGLLLL